MHIYSGGKMYLDRDFKKKKLGTSDHFPEGTGYKSWFCEINVIIDFQSSFNNSSFNKKK